MTCVEPIRDLEKIELIKKLLKKRNERDYLMFILGINCGLRISDMLKLKVSDVKDRNSIELCEQKTGKYRKIPINEFLKKELEIYVSGKQNDEWLFSNMKSKSPISRIQAYRIIYKICKSVGIEDNIGTHTLRKTFGYHFYKKTNNIPLLQYIFNHSSSAVTLRYIGINRDIADKYLYDFTL